MTDSVADKDWSSPALPMIRALMGGTRAMREAGERWLPQEPLESREEYKVRLNRTTLFNGFRKTVRDMSGKVFSTPIAVEAGSSSLLDWLENVDMAGRALNNFAHEVFKDAMAAGVSYILVDSPPLVEGETRANSPRPYMVHVREEDFLGFHAEVGDSGKTLSQVRIRERKTERDPEDEFKSKQVEQVRVFDRIGEAVQVRVYRKSEGNKDAHEWVLHDGPFATGLSEITIVPVYTNQTEFMRGEPPLEDLADLNVTHWQSSSDQRNILHVVRVPILFCKGFRPEHDNDGEVIEISIRSLTTTSNPDADLGWVEHTGAGIEAGRNDLKDLEFLMQAQGLQLLVESNSGDTATGEVLDEAKMTSPLGMMADNLSDAMEQAIIFMAMHGALGEIEATVTVNKDFGVGRLQSHELTALIQMVTARLISQELFVTELIRRGVIDSSVSVDEVMEQIEDDDGELNRRRDVRE